MKNKYLNLPFVVVCILLCVISTPYAQNKILLDTDFGGDADDLGALAILHNLYNEHKCDIVGIMCYNVDKDAIAAIDAVNQYYGSSNISLGIRNRTYHPNPKGYCTILATTFAHTLTNDDVPLCTDQYRKILSNSPDSSIVLVTLGPLDNIKDLICSKPDKNSQLTGIELMAKKIKFISMMGGGYPQIDSEWNFWGNNAGIARYVIEQLSGRIPITIVGYEVGQGVKIGHEFNTLPHTNPLYPGFLYFSEHADWMKQYFKGEILDNACYDQITLMHGIYGDKHIGWEIISGWRCAVADNSATQWTIDPQSPHKFMKLSKDTLTLKNEVLQLMIKEPTKR